MKVLFEKSFGRDLKKIKDKQLLQQVRGVISQVETAAAISDVSSVKKMQGYDSYYRIRVGDYRIGIEIVDGQVIFVCFLNRKDIYRYFP